MQTSLMSWFDSNEPIAVPYYSENEAVVLNKLVFTHEDNPYIPPKGNVTLYTCTWKNYVSLRNTLTCLFSGFVTVMNCFQGIMQSINPNNTALCNLLYYPEHELFVVPSHKNNLGTRYTEGGVRLVTKKFLDKGNKNTRHVNIYVGQDMNYWGHYLIDGYFESTKDVKDNTPNMFFV